MFTKVTVSRTVRLAAPNELSWFRKSLFALPLFFKILYFIHSFIKKCFLMYSKFTQKFWALRYCEFCISCVIVFVPGNISNCGLHDLYKSLLKGRTHWFLPVVLRRVNFLMLLTTRLQTSKIIAACCFVNTIILTQKKVVLKWLELAFNVLKNPVSFWKYGSLVTAWRKEKERRHIAAISFVICSPCKQVLDCEDILNFSVYLTSTICVLDVEVVMTFSLF